MFFERRFLNQKKGAKKGPKEQSKGNEITFTEQESMEDYKAFKEGELGLIDKEFEENLEKKKKQLENINVVDQLENNREFMKRRKKNRKEFYKWFKKYLKSNEGQELMKKYEKVFKNYGNDIKKISLGVADTYSYNKGEAFFKRNYLSEEAPWAYDDVKVESEEGYLKVFTKELDRLVADSNEEVEGVEGGIGQMAEKVDQGELEKEKKRITVTESEGALEIYHSQRFVEELEWKNGRALDAVARQMLDSKMPEDYEYGWRFNIEGFPTKNVPVIMDMYRRLKPLNGRQELVVSFFIGGEIQKRKNYFIDLDEDRKLDPNVRWYLDDVGHKFEDWVKEQEK